MTKASCNLSAKLPTLFLVGLLVMGCKAEIFFQSRKYQGGGNTLEFYPDHSYQYLQKMEGGYVYKFSRGTWKQTDGKIFLLNEVTSPDELPVSVSTNASRDSDLLFVVNILPKKNPNFAYLPGATDLLNVDLVIDTEVYPLEAETNVVRLQRRFNKCYVRAYPKPGVERMSEILNDTLRSETIILKKFENQIVVVDVDCNPDYLAQIKLPNDTLRIINDHRIKWDKINLERPR